MDILVFVLAGAFSTATPLLLAAMGELVAEKSGIINLSVEGMMALAAAVAFIITFHSGSHLAGFLGGMLAAVALSLIFSMLVLVFSANQIASGLAVGLLGLGLSALFGRSYESLTIPAMPDLKLPWLADIQVLGPLLFQHDIAIYLTLAAGVFLSSFMMKSRPGLILRVVGEDPHIAHNLGFRVIRVRFLAILFGASLAGLAGAYASIALTPIWSQGMIVGRGWIAIALVVFGTWRVLRIMVGAYLFGALLLADLAAQAVGVGIPPQIMTSMPYIMTIVVLAVVSRDALRIKLNAPVALGENYRPAN